MNKQNRIKKAYLLLASYFIILFTVKSSDSSKKELVTYNPSFSITNDNYYGTYKNCRIIIGTKKYIESLDEYDKNNIYIIDSRYSEDPDISIHNSFKWFMPATMSDLIRILIDYEAKNPTEWNRTYRSMFIEYLFHNFSYYLNHETERTSQVDFDNSDESLYSSYRKIIEEILTNHFDDLIADEIDKQSQKTLAKKETK